MMKVKVTKSRGCQLSILFLLALATHATQGMWTEVFSKPEEQKIAKNSFVTAFDQKKTWRISFDFFPGKYPATKVYSIFQLTQGESDKKFGTRSPALFLKSGKFYIINTYKSKMTLPKNKRAPLNTWTELVFEQREEANGEYVFVFLKDGVEEHRTTNDDPREYTDMKVFFSNEWHNALPQAKIRNLYIGTWIATTTTTTTSTSTTTTTTTTTTTATTTTTTTAETTSATTATMTTSKSEMPVETNPATTYTTSKEIQTESSSPTRVPSECEGETDEIGNCVTPVYATLPAITIPTELPLCDEADEDCNNTKPERVIEIDPTTEPATAGMPVPVVIGVVAVVLLVAVVVVGVVVCKRKKTGAMPVSSVSGVSTRAKDPRVISDL